MNVAIVIPTTGRDSLATLLDALATGDGPAPAQVIVVDDRRDRSTPLPHGPTAPRGGITLLPGTARGPAAARNVGWRHARTDWVAFLDDDVVPAPDWRARLADDLARLPADVAASQGRIRVPLPPHRRPTDWERNVAGLESARWATADMAYRRGALAALGGFDERFRRAYREDADLGLRATESGWRIARGERWTWHPVRPADDWVSVRLQRGNADDALMRALHGPTWRERAGSGRGRFARHATTVAAAAVAAAAAAARRPQLAAAAATVWAAATAELAWARIAPGPRTGPEVRRMLKTSAVLPLAAVCERLRGAVRARALPHGPTAPRLSAVLFDRDGTLIHDIPHNADPSKVKPVPGARRAIERLRAHGLAIGVVSNQSRVAREDVAAVNARVEELVGPLDVWAVCPHGPDAGCDCRKPRPGLVLDAAAQLGVPPERCAVVGDIGADVEAAAAAGARSVLVPTPMTRQEEVDAAPVVAPDIVAATELLLGGPRERHIERRADPPPTYPLLLGGPR